MPAHCSFSPTTIHHTGRERCFFIVGLVVSIALYLRLFLLIFPSEGCVLDLKVQSQYISYLSTQRTYHFSCCVPTFSLRVSIARRTVSRLRYGTGLRGISRGTNGLNACQASCCKYRIRELSFYNKNAQSVTLFIYFVYCIFK